MYVSRFPKGDQDNIIQLNKKILKMVDSYESIEEKIEKYNYQFVVNNIDLINKGELDKIYIRKALQTFLYLTANDVLSKGILERIIHDDIQKQVSGIYTSGRLQYIKYSTKELQVDGADCLHVYKLINALAINDFELVNKFLVSLPGPSKHGHRYSKLICNALYAILRKDENEIDKWAGSLRKYNEKGVFDRALIDAMLSIIEGSFDKLPAAIESMLSNNKKKYKTDGAVQYVCIPAHAVINLTEWFHGKSLSSLVEEIESLYLDKEFYFRVREHKEGFTDFCDFTELNPTLQNWIRDLPLDLHLENMVEF